MRIWLFVPAYNPGNFLRLLILTGRIKQSSLLMFLVKLIKIRVKIVRHNGYIALQVAGVGIDNRLFAEVLSRIKLLRCHSLKLPLFVVSRWRDVPNFKI